MHISIFSLLLSFLTPTHSIDTPATRSSGAPQMAPYPQSWPPFFSPHPQVRPVIPFNVPVCYDGIALSRGALSPSTSGSCLQMWDFLARNPHIPNLRTLYQPGAPSPLYLHSTALNGCEIQIHSPTWLHGGQVVNARMTEGIVAGINEEMAKGLRQVLDSCVTRALGGEFVYDRRNPQSLVQFGIVVGKQRHRLDGRVIRIQVEQGDGHTGHSGQSGGMGPLYPNSSSGMNRNERLSMRRIWKGIDRDPAWN